MICFKLTGANIWALFMTGIYSRCSLQNKPFMILNNLFIMASGLFNIYEDKEGRVSDQSNIYVGLIDILIDKVSYCFKE